MSDHNHNHGDDCGCGHDHDHDEEVFVVTDQDGNEHEMVMVYTFEVKEQAYAVLLDRNEPESDGVIFRIEEENEEAFLASIEDEEEWNRVVKVYEELMEQDNS
jgi:uncharacterized protein YrzB (UPF0473 family)